MRKPSWMANEDWRGFVELHDGDFYCAACGQSCRDDLTVDHRLARHEGGTDALSNLQVLCRRENSKKGVRREAYWDQAFYWDQPVDLSKLRTAQRVEAWEKVLSYQDWFTRPWSEIARVLYTLAWVIGSGKSMAIPVLAWALNYVIRREVNAAARRIDRVLVLCKEVAIRDQLADDLENDVVRFEICGIPPKVGVIKEGFQLDTPFALDQKDIWCSTIAMFYEQNGQPRPGLERVLSRFPLIVIDEPHYAREQVLKLVDAATTSLCFGLTATPIDATGELLRKFVLFSQFPYESAVEFDQSLKFISARPEHRAEMVVELDISEAEQMQPTGTRVIRATHEVGSYEYQLVPAKSVLERVIFEVQEYDRAAAWSQELAPHRQPPERFEPSLRYPAHALISCDTIPIARMLADTANQRFQGNRELFPEAKGYRATVVHTEYLDRRGIFHPGDRLGPSHPWFHAANHDGDLAPDSARFLIVVGMAREGVNNPLCSIVGVAGSSHSIVEIVQRALGRPARSVMAGWPGGGAPVRVPPRPLDAVTVVTHKAFRNTAAIEAGLEFVTDMREHFEKLRTVDDLIADRAAPGEEQPKAVEGLTTKQKLRLAAAVGEDRLDPSAGRVASAMADLAGDNSERAAGCRTGWIW